MFSPKTTRIDDGRPAEERSGAIEDLIDQQARTPQTAKSSVIPTPRFTQRLRGFGWFAALTAACWLASAGLARAQDFELEYKLKAAFLFNFISFVEWPTNKVESTNTTIIVGCLPDDPAAPVMARAFAGKGGRPIKLVVFKEKDDPRDCHLLFISRARKALADETLQKLQKAPVLTVSEIDLFAHRGGMINFVRHELTFRFEINLEATERAGLRISSRLASMATVVKTTIPP